MSAYMNALREEGTPEDLLREIERLMDERDALRARFDAIAMLMRRIIPDATNTPAARREGCER